jgi:alkanesulfonate monooxygenase SsuD/methylene tetrahydromethanopterin reductase-like flavin-dependent oxidoreductase (luciferase family)
MAPTFRFGVMYDCRRTPDSSLSMTDVYAATIEQAVLADQFGFDHVWFTEHHFLEDGYLPAEMAVLDNISNGRMELGIGMGYVPEEFEAFGVPLKNRVSMTEEGIDILRLAWGDGPFSYAGKRYRMSDVDVHPKPVQPGGPPLWIAAMSTPGALRAARFGTNLLPQGQRAEVLDPYRAAVAEDGRNPDDFRTGIIRSFYVSDDRERDWPVVREAERFRMAVYNTFMESTPDDYGWRNPGGIPQSSFMGTADECIAEMVSFATEYGVTDIASSGLPPGVDPEFMNTNIERLASEVLPTVRERLGR